MGLFWGHSLLFTVDLLLVKAVNPGLRLAVTVGRCYLVPKIMGLAGFKQLPGRRPGPGQCSLVNRDMRQRQNMNQSRDNESAQPLSDVTITWG